MTAVEAKASSGSGTAAAVGRTGTGQGADAELLRLGYTPQLERSLSFRSLLVYGLLFFVPMAPVAVFGHVSNISGGVPVLVYLVAALVMGLSAVSYREMALRFPVAGSVYGYVRLATGRRAGFLAGWLILLDYVLMPALLTVLGSVALKHIWPGVPTVAFAVLFVVGSLLLNLLGIEVTTRVGFVLLAIQLVVVAMVIVFVGAAVAQGRVSLSGAPLWHAGVSPEAVLAAVSLAALSYLGFDAVATLNEEARGGGQAVARATTVLLALLTGLFAVQVFAAALVAGPGTFAKGGATSRAFYRAVDTVAPEWFTTVFTMTNAFVAIFSCLVVAHAATARLLFAMGRDGVLPRVLGRTSASGTPVVATAVVGVIAMVVSVAFAEQDSLMTQLVTFGALSSYVVLHVAVLVHCLRGERSGRWWTHGVVPVLGVVSLVAVLWQTPGQARTVGGIWLALGVLGALVTSFVRSRRPATVTAAEAGTAPAAGPSGRAGSTENAAPTPSEPVER